MSLLTFNILSLYYLANWLKPMSIQRIARINAILFFLFWLLVLLAGADFPPPRGFLRIVLLIALCAIVVSWRVPIYIDWYSKKRPGRQWRVLIEGFAAGIVMSIVFAISSSGEPSVSVEPINYVLWVAVLGVVGTFTSAALYLINALLSKKLNIEE